MLALNPVSVHVSVGAATVHTVVDVGAVRRTTYCVGAALGALGAFQVTVIDDELAGVAALLVGFPTSSAVARPEPELAGVQLADAVPAVANTTQHTTTAMRTRCFMSTPAIRRPSTSGDFPALGQLVAVNVTGIVNVAPWHPVSDAFDIATLGIVNESEPLAGTILLVAVVAYVTPVVTQPAA